MINKREELKRGKKRTEGMPIRGVKKRRERKEEKKTWRNGNEERGSGGKRCREERRCNREKRK